MLLEEVLDHTEMDKIFMSRFEKKIKDNQLYRNFISREISLIRYRSPSSYSLMEILLISYNEEVDKWEISFLNNKTNNILSILLISLRVDYGIFTSLEELLEIIDLSVLIIKDITKTKVVELKYHMSKILNKCLILFELRERLLNDYGYTSLISNLGDNMSLVVLNINKKIYLSVNARESPISIHNSYLILPYDSGDIYKTVESYFKDLKLTDHLNNFKLQTIFEEDKTSVIEKFNLQLSNFGLAFKELKNKNLYDLFHNANPKADFQEIIELSVVTDFPSEPLIEPTPKQYTFGHTTLLKTQHGVYYLRSDHKSIGYLSLADVYKNAAEAYF